MTELRFQNYLKQMGIDLEGSILEIACGPISLGCIYENVHGHDNSPESSAAWRRREYPHLFWISPVWIWIILPGAFAT